MKKEWFFDCACGEIVAVYAEDGRIVEIGVEDVKEGDVIGNIYKGRVANVVPGMQASFISCGMERNCYLPLEESNALISQYDEEEYVKKAVSLSEGDEVLVQIVKAPRGNKGAKVSCNLSFVGKNLIYLPQTDFLGISRKITDEATREKLLKEVEKLRKEGEGFIVRTAAINASKRQFKTESEFLKRLYRQAIETAQKSPVGVVVYREYDLPVKILRDNQGDEITKIYVGDEALYKRLLELVRMRADLGEKKLVYHKGPRSIFTEYYNLSDQIASLATREIKLGSGAYLVVDRTEAMTVFDVNTGKYTGEHDLESTVFETNLLAAKEIARQVRLRNVGGIIAVDFIDMESPEHRSAVNLALERALLADKIKCKVLPMSDLCVTLFTRKRTSGELSYDLLKPCPHCTRQGFVLSDYFMAMEIRGAILNCFAEGYSAAIIELNRALMNKILSEQYFKKEREGAWKNKRIYMIPHSTYHEERFEIRGDNNTVLTLPDDAQILY